MSIKQRLKNNELVLGTFVSELRNPNVAYLLAQCGFDYLIFDNEHGAFSHETVSDMIAASRGAGIDVIVRVPEIRREAILKPLDSGAVGLLIPQVNTADEAAEVVKHAKYPPRGSRGAATRRAHNRYAQVEAASFLKQANEDTFIAVQAETVEAIKNIEAIAAVEGIDAVFCGPFDLSISLGIPGQVNDPREVAAVDKMVAACQRHGKASGILMFDPAHLKPWIDKGMRFIAYSSDVNMLADAASAALAELRGHSKA
jgi:2-dehydro-3-deoxyglucarate aldolase/4-hydroxy-2-oxoheptanedioate aldolase